MKDIILAEIIVFAALLVGLADAFTAIGRAAIHRARVKQPEAQQEKQP